MRCVTSQITEPVSSTCSLSGSTHSRASALQVFCLIGLTWGWLDFGFVFNKEGRGFGCVASLCQNLGYKTGKEVKAFQSR